jgi:hypothetical protein
VLGVTASPQRRLLRFLALAGWRWLAAVALVELFLLVEPTAVALVTGALVGHLAEGAAAGGSVGTMLFVLGALLVTGNVAGRARRADRRAGRGQRIYEVYQRYAEAAQQWQQATGGITLLVSHRFATIRMADLIVVLDDGRIIEYGTHAQLIDRAGRYAHLYNLQASAYR